MLDVPDAPIVVLADADRIGQVVTGYLSNALKYAPEDQPVTVRLEATSDDARVSVHDEGPGLPPDQQERVWEAFYQAPGVETQSGSSIGLGLGLSICRTIVERHGGRVGVESAVGQGATFWFTLPLAPTGAPTAPLPGG
jgi:signal transduction histidine kinase